MKNPRFRPLGALLGGLLEASWGVLAATCAVLGSSSASASALRASRGPLGPSWGPLGALLGRSGAVCSPMARSGRPPPSPNQPDRAPGGGIASHTPMIPKGSADFSILADPVALGVGPRSRHDTLCVICLCLASKWTCRLYTPMHSAPAMPIGAHGGDAMAALLLRSMAQHPAQWGQRALGLASFDRVPAGTQRALSVHAGRRPGAPGTRGRGNPFPKSSSGGGANRAPRGFRPKRASRAPPQRPSRHALTARAPQ